VKCNLNAVVYAINCGADIQYLQLQEIDEPERLKFNDNCKKFGLEQRMLDYTIEHDKNHELWRYDPVYDNINLRDFFLQKCTSDEARKRVEYELDLYCRILDHIATVHDFYHAQLYNPAYVVLSQIFYSYH
jgi:hypothetical protein